MKQLLGCFYGKVDGNTCEKGADAKRNHYLVCVHSDTRHLVYEVTRVPLVSFSLGSQDAMKIPREADFVDLR